MAYRQEYHKGEAEDVAEVMGLPEMAEVPAGKYKDAMLTRDTTPLEPDSQEYKLYAKGVGPVLIMRTSGGSAPRGTLGDGHSARRGRDKPARNDLG